MKLLTWDGSGAIVIHKNLDAGKFDLPRASRVGKQHVMVSDVIFDVIYKGVAVTPTRARRRSRCRARARGAAQDVELGRGTMCRYVEEAGNLLGATIGHAVWQDSLKNGCIISTDATSALV